MELKENTYYAKNRKEWRSWLTKNSKLTSNIWLIIYHKNSKKPSLTYDEAVEEALCFGWIDSIAHKRDEHSKYQFFAQRKPRSNWSKANRQRAEKMIAAGQMKPAGMAMIQVRDRLVPLVWAAASPSAHVTRDAYERIAGAMIERLRAAGAVDGVYLDLHGAMVAEHTEDGEGELLKRIRGIVGGGLPIVASLDYHANLTPDMAALATALVGYRTYPHIDMAETGRRAAGLLDKLNPAWLSRYPGIQVRTDPALVPADWQVWTFDR